MAEMIGETFGSYRLTERIGRGGMAEVYKALHTSLAVFRALKVIRPEFVLSDDFRTRFLKEAQSVAQLRHPNIVQVHDFGTHNSMYFMVMEYVEGTDLKKLLQREGPIRPIERAIALVLPITRALEYAHARGLVHRDIKPDNIMLNENGDPILMDFGIAKLVTGGTQLTQTGMAIGTPEYMAPEQALGTSEVGPATDIYSLCVVLFELLIGRVPFTAETPVGIAIKTINEPLPMPQSLSPDIGDELQAVLLKGTAKRVADRYDSVVSLRNALESLIARGTAISGSLAASPINTATLLRPTINPAPVTALDAARTTMRQTAPVTGAAGGTAGAGTAATEELAAGFPTQPALHVRPPATPSPAAKGAGLGLVAALVLGVAAAGGGGYWLLTRPMDGGTAKSAAAEAPAESPPVAQASQPAAETVAPAPASPAATPADSAARTSAPTQAATNPPPASTPSDGTRTASASFQPTGPGAPPSAASEPTSPPPSGPPPSANRGPDNSPQLIQGGPGYVAPRSSSTNNSTPGFGPGQAQVAAATQFARQITSQSTSAARTLAQQPQRTQRSGSADFQSQLASSRLIPQGVIPGKVGGGGSSSSAGSRTQSSSGGADERAQRGQTTQSEISYRFGDPDSRQAGGRTWVYERNLSQADVSDNTFAAQIATGLNDFFRPANRGQRVRTINVVVHFGGDETLTDFTADASYF